MHAIEIKQLYKTYAGGVEALKGIDLTIESGDFFALLGANGAGKSTTIGLISSLLTKTSGSIQVCGVDLDKNPTQAKQYLGLVPQEINLNIFEPCHQILVNQAGYYGISREKAHGRADELLKQLGLWHKKNTIVRRLSGGMKRRLMIARALMHHPRVLILDEPTAGVDIEIRHSMWEFLKRTNAKGTTIILTTHYLEEAEQLCKHIAIIDKGKLVENTSTQALLGTLQHQTYVFSTEKPINFLPDLSPWEANQIDAHTFELRVDNQHTLNQVFARLDEQGLVVRNLRNKTNRLEELFMDLISS
ncbi:MAG: ABC transporter ATP-binding protein [Legionella sp.]|nr:ABC transporter ATP-binding protein [Legionella sp.]